MRRYLLLGAAALVLLGGCSSGGGGGGGGSTAPTTPESTLSTYDGAPPWPVADRQADRMAKAGLPALTAEGSVVHYHAHLDVVRNGEPVVVPAGVGIDYDKQRISPMHTHFDTGVIHIEADKAATFTLAQFLMEWGVRLNRDCVGDVCAPSPIAVYVNGAKFDGGITDLVIQADKEIALILGTPPASVPKGYTCDPRDACPGTPPP